jgi:hypothetical protein
LVMGFLTCLLAVVVLAVAFAVVFAKAGESECPQKPAITGTKRQAFVILDIIATCVQRRGLSTLLSVRLSKTLSFRNL